GAVIGFAGAGQPPFGADSPPVVAVRIMTQAPALDWLTGPLRELVEQALAKDPAQRPTARELLDRLLAAGPSRSGAGAAALARPAPSSSAVPSPRPTVTPTVAAGAELIISDPLTGDRYWRAREDKINEANCAFSGALVVTKQAVGPFRCPGPPDLVTDDFSAY